MAVKEHPILFNGEMVRAILEGRKAQTRRVLLYRGETPKTVTATSIVPYTGTGEQLQRAMEREGYRCHYGQPGDRLWVRETWAISSPYNQLRYQDNGVTSGPVWYAADDFLRVDFKDRADIVYGRGKWRPSIHMPRWASRITLELVAVRVERVKEISEFDAREEGISDFDNNGNLVHKGHAFRRLWNSINASRGYGWDANPFVWVVEFKIAERAGL